MTEGPAEAWNRNKFLMLLNDTDSDLQINGMNMFNAYLEKVTIFNRPEGEFPAYTNTIFSLLSSKEVDLINVILRSIILMASKFPTSTFPYIFDPVFYTAYDQNFENVPQLCAILRELFTFTISFDEERRVALKKDVFPRIDLRLNDTTSGQLIFTLDLMTSLIESLGSLFEPIELDKVEEHIKRTITKDPETAAHAAQLAKFWALYTSKEQLDRLFAFLFKRDSLRPAFLVISSLVCYSPKTISPYAKEIFSLFLSLIKEETEKINDMLEKDGNLDVSRDTDFISTMTDAITSLSVLIPVYPDLALPSLSTLNELAYTYLCYQTAVFDDDDEEEEDADEGAEIDTDMAIPEMDIPDTTGEDSWKLRKAAILLLQALIKTFPAKALEEFIAADEEGNYVHFDDIQKMIRDFDGGALKVALQALCLIIRTYKTDLSLDYAFYWYATVAKQIAKRPELADQFLETLATLSNELSEVSEGQIAANLPDLALAGIVKTQEKSICESNVASVLQFLRVVLKTTSDISEVLGNCSQVVLAVLSLPKSVLPALDAAALLFSKTSEISENSSEHSKEGLEQLSRLAKAIVGLAEASNDKTSAAVEALGLYVIARPAVKESKGALDAIVRGLSSGVAMRSACATIALIASSPRAEVLKPVSQSALKALSQVELGDLNVVYALLWAVRSLLDKQLVGPGDCAALLPKLVDLVTIGDVKCKDQAFIILQKLPGKEKALGKIKELLTTSSNLPEYALEAAAALVRSCKGADAEIQDLITAILKSMNEETSVFVGIVAAAFKSISNQLVANFVSSASPTAFEIECVGQLCAQTDLSSNAALIDKLFALLKSAERQQFTAAAAAVGAAAAGSVATILPRLLHEAEEDPSRSTLYLLALQECARKCRKARTPLSPASVKAFLAYLWKNADYASDNAQTVSQTLQQLVLLDDATHQNSNQTIEQNGNQNSDKNETFAEILAKAAGGDEKVAPVAGRAIAELFNSKRAGRLVRANLGAVIGMLGTDIPALGGWVLAALRASFKHGAGEEMESQLLKALDKIIASTALKPNHMQTKFYGLQSQLVDIGRPQRLNALELLVALLQAAPDRLDGHLLAREALGVVADIQQGLECRSKALQLLEKLVQTKYTAPAILDKLADVTAALEMLKNDIMDHSNDLKEAEGPLMRFLAIVHLKGQRGICAEFERLFAFYEKDKRMETYLDDLGFAAKAGNAKGEGDQAETTASRFMNQYNPEAAGVFAI